MGDREDEIGMKVTEEWIITQAPNTAAVQNGRKLSQKGSFSQLGKLEDGSLFWAECAGSGKNPYHTSVDFSEGELPTYRCSCPSHQFPCKHAIGLLFEIAQEKPFVITEVPEDLAEKRAKKAARAAKKEKAFEDRPEKPKRTNQAAKEKKIKKQLEGIDRAEQMISDLLAHGLGTLNGASVKTYETLAKDLGSCYLTGAQTAFIRLANEIRSIQKNPNNTSYDEAFRILIHLNAMLQKARLYLQEKLEKKEFEREDNLLYEALGGVWKLEELEKIGCVKENARLVQLSFDVLFDKARNEYIDRGYWMELTDGTIYQTLNYRPVKALKYVKAEDTCFALVNTPKLCYYPGTGCQRVRWEGSELTEVDAEVLGTVRKFASTELAQVVKQVKNQIKNTMSEKYVPVVLAFDTIGKIGEDFVLQTESGERIVLRDRAEEGADHRSVYQLDWLMGTKWKKGQVLFGLMYYHGADSSLCLHPYSLVTEEQIIRLQY